jgi:4-diphosphocytidyl-2-C-methyl-D-erythritol kinase
MLCFPNCKINLGLHVTRRREDGYHDIETVFYPVMFRDVLEIVTSPCATLRVSGIKLGGKTDDNLVWKAYQLMQYRFPGIIPPQDIYLQKNIPTRAGLGGGSADGAFMLRLLNERFELGLDNETLAEMALQLGSDCPFFIYNTPKAATGRGEKMTDIAIDLSGYSIQLICPRVHVSTRDAFSNIIPRPAEFPLLQLGTIPVSDWKERLKNDFETTVFQRYPELAVIKEQLYAQGAIYASMSGSGSAIYSIFPKGKRAKINSDVGFKVFYAD